MEKTTPDSRIGDDRAKGNGMMGARRMRKTEKCVTSTSFVGKLQGGEDWMN